MRAGPRPPLPAPRPVAKPHSRAASPLRDRLLACWTAPPRHGHGEHDDLPIRTALLAQMPCQCHRNLCLSRRLLVIQQLTHSHARSSSMAQKRRAVAFSRWHRSTVRNWLRQHLLVAALTQQRRT